MRGLAVLFLLCAAGFSQRPPVFRTETRLVQVTFRVTDGNGALIPDLTKDDFKVFDGTSERPILAFSGERGQPLTLGLVFVEGDLKAFRQQTRDYALSFVRGVIRPGDRVFLVTSGPNVRLLTGETGSMRSIEAAFESSEERLRGAAAIPQRYGMPAFDTLALCLDRVLHARPGRKAILLVSNAAESRSRISEEEILEKLQGNDVVVYWLLVTSSSTPRDKQDASPNDFLLDRSLERHEMGRIAYQTGGFAFTSEDAQAGFARMEDEMRTVYTLGFAPVSPVADGRFHRIRIECRRGGTTVRHRAGYRDLPRGGPPSPRGSPNREPAPGTISVPIIGRQ